MRVWLIEQEGCAGTQTSLEPLLRSLAYPPAQGLSLAGVSWIIPDLAERARQAGTAALVCNCVSCPQSLDTVPLLSLGIPVLVAGAGGHLEAWLKLAEQHTVGFVPASAGAPEIRAALQSLVAGQRREESLRSQVQRLNQRLTDRIVIEKAKGVLMQRLGIGEEEAYKRLRVQSRRQRKQVREIAQSILDAEFIWELDGTAEPGPLASDGPKPRRPKGDTDSFPAPAHIVERSRE